jgi:D-alanyl-D-alanine carboxypeptidase/D-alanyl-D-alanine-endopeptidase (penicillin-binding protein 4)
MAGMTMTAHRRSPNARLAASSAASRRTNAALPALLPLVLLLVLSIVPAAMADLSVRLKQLVAEFDPTGSTTGVVIMDSESGEILAAHNLNRALIPASNQKLLTTGAALFTLGPEFRFQTELIHQPADHRLIVRASGDPAFGDPVLLEQMGMDVESLLDMWATAWLNAGTTPPTEIVIDDRVFDQDFIHSSWPRDQLNRWYCAEVAGLNFHTNVVAIYARPQGQGQRPLLSLAPRAPWLEVGNEARSVTSGDQTLWASRAHNTNRIVVHGDVRWNGQPVRVTINDVPLFFGKLLASRIAEKSETAPLIRVRRAAADERFERGKVVHTVRSSMPVILQRTNEDSINLYADALLKRMGYEVTKMPGSWADGTAVLRMVLHDKIGSEATRDLAIADGSGMSRENRISPRAMGEWLRAVQMDDRVGQMFIDSLPTPGKGTLSSWFVNRKLNNSLHAKTGTLSDVSALSGYLIHPASGRTLVVVTMVNDWSPRVSRASVRKFQESVFMAADAWLTANAQELNIGG